MKPMKPALVLREIAPGMAARRWGCNGHSPEAHHRHGPRRAMEWRAESRVRLSRHCRPACGENRRRGLSGRQDQAGSQGTWGAIAMPAQSLPEADARLLARWLATGRQQVAIRPGFARFNPWPPFTTLCP
jgi:hypothetical protein